MTTLSKVLIGIGSVVAGVVVAAVIDKKCEYVTVNGEKKEESEMWKRFKKAAVKKVAKILEWSIKHMDQIQAAGAILGVVGCVLDVTSAIRNFRTRDKTLTMLKEIRNVTYDNGWCAGYNSLFDDLVKETSTCAKNGTAFTIWDKDKNPIARYKLVLV